MKDNEITFEDKFADFLKEKRLMMGLTMRQFAHFLLEDERRASWICDIENKKRRISVNTLSKILHKLNSTLEIVEH